MMSGDEQLDWKITIMPAKPTPENKDKGYKISAEGWLILPKGRGSVNFQINLEPHELATILDKARQAIKQTLAEIQGKTLEETKDSSDQAETK